ncbi:MAG: response regulator transcription factor [Candidatus Thiodiazotropha sp. (ex. Lucinisca nassula)]|nr:response regulator transcription factor [Candidatus Thiodiazotropha sp. (ex. Lucinisca nassula)]MBW9275528.1 response regulator transcription factor [Candidatus Thiodiazotropha sp. (ex. Lucinisca nassula)]PUB82102.1 MAG: DNA-binding response regulator [gamma proteobacterium symbiont of Ctena orbiculata]
MHKHSDNDAILLVDDDIPFTRLVGKYLIDAGYDVSIRHNGLQAIEFTKSYTPQLIILDLMMPDTDGLTACKEIRKWYTGPILILTALNEEVDEIVGLEVGADDYIGKPLKPRVLLARIRALMRRDKDYAQSEDTVNVGNMAIYCRSRTVYIEDSLLDFTDAEFDLLVYLAKRAGTVVARDDIYNDILHFKYDGMDRTLDIRISRLRKKISAYENCRIKIKTVRLQGYLFVDNA